MLVSGARGFAPKAGGMNGVAGYVTPLKATPHPVHSTKPCGLHSWRRSGQPTSRTPWSGWDEPDGTAHGAPARLEILAEVDYYHRVNAGLRTKYLHHSRRPGYWRSRKADR